MALMLWLSHARAQVGVVGVSGESMLVDMRDRLRAQGELPELPPSWRAEVALESAYGDGFAGDFVVASRSTDGHTLEIALVDVSGKGAQGRHPVAAALRRARRPARGDERGRLPPVGQQPPAAAALGRGLRHRGARRRRPRDRRLHHRLCRPPCRRAVRGRFRPVADALRWPAARCSVSSTRPTTPASRARCVAATRSCSTATASSRPVTRTLVDGIDRMLGRAESFVRTGFDGLAQRLCDHAAAGLGDDRAVVMIWRG